MDPEKKKARRSFVRRNHPDVGGDSDAFVAGLSTYDEKPPLPPLPPPAPPAPPRVPTTDRMARGFGRIAKRMADLPGEMKDGYKEGRDTDNPL